MCLTSLSRPPGASTATVPSSSDGVITAARPKLVSGWAHVTL